MKLYKNPQKSVWERLCSRPALAQENLDELCITVFDRVAQRGDFVLLDYTKQFDGVELSSAVLEMSAVKAQAQKTSNDLQKAIKIAYKNIKMFHQQQKLQKNEIETMTGVLCWQESRAIESVGLYIPGGNAPLVSTVLMLGAPAQIAGCKEIILASPPNKEGLLEPAICYAALLCGVTKVIRVGGTQAIAAMSIGTQSVPKVDKIFGPGNQYVTAAKQLAVKYGVAIDMPAGPSEVMVVADETANPAFVAADLLSQAEHGSDSQVVFLTTSKKQLEAVKVQLALQLEKLPRKDIAQAALNNSFCVYFDSIRLCIEFANVYAPEHIILSVKRPKYWVSQVQNAGSVFLGNYSPESAGDYASGTNHTLPTAGWARSYGGVSLDSFVKKITFQSLTREGLKTLAPTIEQLALAEGLDAHARAVTIRTNAK